MLRSKQGWRSYCGALNVRTGLALQCLDVKESPKWMYSGSLFLTVLLSFESVQTEFLTVTPNYIFWSFSFNLKVLNRDHVIVEPFPLRAAYGYDWFTVIGPRKSTFANLTKKFFEGKLSTGLLKDSETDGSDEDIDSAFLDGQDDWYISINLTTQRSLSKSFTALSSSQVT